MLYSVKKDVPLLYAAKFNRMVKSNLKLLADIILHLSLKYPDLLELNKENT